MKNKHHTCFLLPPRDEVSSSSVMTKIISNGRVLYPVDECSSYYSSSNHHSYSIKATTIRRFRIKLFSLIPKSNNNLHNNNVNDDAVKFFNDLKYYKTKHQQLTNNNERFNQIQSAAKRHNDDKCTDNSDSSSVFRRHDETRKLLLRQSLFLPFLMTPFTFLHSQVSIAADMLSSSSSDSVGSNDNVNNIVDPMTSIIDLLHDIPTYTIVDNDGVPFMVVGEDAKVTGYFFIEYNEAVRILKAASRSADNTIQQAIKSGETLENDQLINPWKNAYISTVPLDFAITLCLKSNTKEIGLGNFYQIAPSESDIIDALVITKKESLQEGKVPLFYDPDVTVSDDNKKSPLYFQRVQLEQDYKRELKRATNNNNNIDNQQRQQQPNIQVTELFAILRELGKTTTTSAKNTSSDDDPLIASTIALIPPIGSIKKSNEIIKNSKNKSPFVLGKRNLIL